MLKFVNTIRKTLIKYDVFGRVARKKKPFLSKAARLMFAKLYLNKHRNSRMLNFGQMRPVWKSRVKTLFFMGPHLERYAEGPAYNMSAYHLNGFALRPPPRILLQA